MLISKFQLNVKKGGMKGIKRENVVYWMVSLEK